MRRAAGWAAWAVLMAPAYIAAGVAAGLLVAAGWLETAADRAREWGCG